MLFNQYFRARACMEMRQAFTTDACGGVVVTSSRMTLVSNVAAKVRESKLKEDRVECFCLLVDHFSLFYFSS